MQPTIEAINNAVINFDNEYRDVEASIESVFGNYPSNDNFRNVLIKTVMLNQLYNTQIYGVVEVAKHIVSLNIDTRLKNKDLSIVKGITEININGKLRRNYSFATKYCSWHYPNVYCIYDSYVEEALWNFSKEFHFSNFKRMELKEYPIFIRVLDDFRIYFSLNKVSKKDMDKYLWFIGKELLKKP